MPYAFNIFIESFAWRRKWQPTQYSCLENSMEGGACGYSPWSGKESDTTA